jgi:Tol biopolymer transport system component
VPNHSIRRAATVAAAFAVSAAGLGTVPAVASAASVAPAAPQPSIESTPSQAPGTTRIVSLRYDGSSTTENNNAPTISDNGRYVAYNTEDRFLLGPEKMPCCQVIRYDRRTKAKEVVSVNRKGKPVRGGGNEPVMSADGNLVAFWSSAKRLVRDDPRTDRDVFIRDMTKGRTKLISRNPSGQPGNGDSFMASISADGTRVAYASAASDLASGDNNQVIDVFLYDAKTGKTTLVSRGLDGKSARGESLAPEISADGSHVVYFSSADNIVDGDHNQLEDVFSYDVAAKTTQIISVAEDGTAANGGSFNPSVSGDGKFVTFWSFASNLAPNDKNDQGDVFLRTTDSPKITLVSHTPKGFSGNGESDDPTISTDGRTVAFQSAASDLDPADTNGFTDVYRYSVSSGQLVIVSTARDGSPADDSSFLPSLSKDGALIAFESVAGNLVRRDTNSMVDAFVYRVF